MHGRETRFGLLDAREGNRGWLGEGRQRRGAGSQTELATSHSTQHDQYATAQRRAENHMGSLCLYRACSTHTKCGSLPSFNEALSIQFLDTIFLYRLVFDSVSYLTPGIWSHVRLKRSKKSRQRRSSNRNICIISTSETSDSLIVSSDTPLSGFRNLRILKKWMH
ncbi:hypothetical protein J6590_042220 [Homalodisca vitripennis]|nr:hypothetical protein J6590_042220 [Homalodisca vitripennis]